MSSQNYCLNILFLSKRMFILCIKKETVEFFGGGRGLNLRPCIYYALSLPTQAHEDKRNR